LRRDHCMDDEKSSIDGKKPRKSLEVNLVGNLQRDIKRMRDQKSLGHVLSKELL